MEKMKACPPIETISALLEGTLDESKSEAIETHLEVCDACLDRFRKTEAEATHGWAFWQQLISTDQSPPSDQAKQGLEEGGTSCSEALLDAFPTLEGFELLEEIGRGGMGVVYRAREIRLNRIVAIKMLLAGALSGPERIRRLRREAEAVAKLQHPGIVQIYSVGEHSGLPFLVLEYSGGGNLKDYAAQLSDWRDAARIVSRAALAVQYAHHQQIVHRDLKPENLLLPDAGTHDLTERWSHPKITDFGLAWTADSETRTSSGASIGTPAYMAPEQVTGIAGDNHKTIDIYGLGSVLYFLLTGRPPFEGDSTAELLQRVVNEKPRAPNHFQPAIPRDLETITLKCLEKNPTDRYATAGELADDLNRCLNHEPIRARSVRLRTRLLRWCRRHPEIAIMLSVICIVTATAAFVVRKLIDETEQAQIAKQDSEVRALRMQGVVDQGVYIRKLSDINHAWLGNDFDSMRRQLEDCPVDHRGWEWRLLKTICERDSVERLRMPSAVTCLTVSTDGQFLATGDRDGHLDVRRIPQDIVVVRTKVLNQPIQYMQFAPLSDRIVLGGQDVVKCFPVSPEEKDTSAIAVPELTSLAFSKSGDWLVVSSGMGKVIQYFAGTGELIAATELPDIRPVGVWPVENDEYLMVISRDGRRLMLDADTLSVLNETSISSVESSGHAIEAALLSQDRRHLLVRYDNDNVRVRNLAERKWERLLVGHRGRILNMALHPSKLLAATCDTEGVTRLWDPLSTGIGSRLVVPDGAAGAVAWLDAAQRLAVGSESGGVRVVRVGVETAPTFGHAAAEVAELRHTSSCRGVCVDSAGHIVVTAEDDGRVLIRDTETLEVIRKTAGHPDRVRGVGLLDERVITAGNDGRIREFDVASGALLSETKIHDTNCTALACSPDNRHVAAGGGSQPAVVFYDTAARTVVRRIAGLFKRTIRSLSFSCDGSLLAATGGPNVHVIDFAAGTELMSLSAHEGRTMFCQFSPDDQLLVTSGSDHSTAIWNVVTGERRFRFQNRIATGFTSDSRRLLVVEFLPDGPRSVEMVELDTGHVVWQCRCEDDAPDVGVFSPDRSRLFAVCCDGRLRRWDAEVEAIPGSEIQPRF